MYINSMNDYIYSHIQLMNSYVFIHALNICLAPVHIVMYGEYHCGCTELI